MMKVRITSVDKWASGYHVSFTSAFGSGHALWNGHPPVTGREYDVELDCGDGFVWGENIYPVKSKRCHIREQNGLLRIAGLLESVDGDGYIIIRMGSFIIPLVTEGAPPEKGVFVEFRASRVTFYDENL